MNFSCVFGKEVKKDCQIATGISVLLVPSSNDGVDVGNMAKFCELCPVLKSYNKGKQPGPGFGEMP